MAVPLSSLNGELLEKKIGITGVLRMQTLGGPLSLSISILINWLLNSFLTEILLCF